MAPPERPQAGARRIADVALRHLTPGGRARAHWPASCADPTVAALVVLFSADHLLVEELIARGGPDGIGAVVMITALTVVMTWVFNNAKGSLLITMSMYPSFNTFANKVVAPLFPAPFWTSTGFYRNWSALACWRCSLSP